MTAAAFLFDLRKRGVILTAAGDKLRVEAPSGVLTDNDRRALADRKPELLAALAEADSALAEVLDLIDQVQNLRPAWALPGVLADLARGYHESGEHGMLQDAVSTARHMLDNVRDAPSPT